MLPTDWKSAATHPATLALLAALLTFAAMKIECMMRADSDPQPGIGTYCKNAAWAAALVGATAYILGRFAGQDTKSFDMSLDGLVMEPDF